MILCCGEALIDMIPAPTPSGAEGFVPHSGGAVFNTAVALGRLGASVGMLTGLSHDMFGAQLQAALQASHVDTAHLVLSDGPTTLAFVKLMDGQASYTFMDENSAGRMLTAADMPAIAPQVAALFFGGISLACEPCADAYAALLAREADERTVMLDPNIRTGFIQDEARYRARLTGMLARTDIVKVSDEDLDWVVQGSGGMDAKAREMLESGPHVVIVTRGGDGASGYLRGGTRIDITAPQVQVADTVGAGDTFNAGFLARLDNTGKLGKASVRAMDSHTLRQALDYGARVAAVTVSRAGANSPWKWEI
jgi:fructokinase